MNATLRLLAQLKTAINSGAHHRNTNTHQRATQPSFANRRVVRGGWCPRFSWTGAFAQGVCRMTSGRFVQAAVVVVLSLLVLVAAGCGGRETSPGVASLHGPSATSGQSSASGAQPGGTSPSSRQQLARFAACIRAHGIPSFPNPNAQGMFDVGGTSGIDPSSPQFQAIQKKCQSLEPPGWQLTPKQVAAIYRQAFAFADCMRGQGLADFPNPTLTNGVVSLNIRGHGDLDFNSPGFQKALKACRASRPPGPGGSMSPGGG